MCVYHECVCGAHLSLPAQAAGKRVRCRSCGLILHVPAQVNGGGVAIAQLETEGSASSTKDPSVVASPPIGIPEPAFREPFSSERLARAGDRPRGGTSFWADALRGLGFPLKRANLAAFAVFCILHAGLLALLMVPVIGVLAWALSALFAMWLCALYFNVLTHAAEAEDELPTVNVTRFGEDVFQPFQQFVACAVAALGPAGGAIWLAMLFGKSVPRALVGPLALGGAFVWPAIILWSGLGGELTIGSIQAVARAVLRPILPYLWTCLTLGVSGLIAASALVAEVRLLAGFLGAGQPTFATAARLLAWKAASTYAWIVAMRQLGIYYLHFRSRFPWHEA